MMLWECLSLKKIAIDTISEVLECTEQDIVDVEILKKGMTNRSILFRGVHGDKKGKYILRIPGEGTNLIIDRTREADVYRAIKGKGLCDNPVYINQNNGLKITRYIENARVCDARSEEDIRKCMMKLREFHEMKLEVNHTFDIFTQIDFYEKLWGGIPSVHKDYRKTKKDASGIRCD